MSHQLVISVRNISKMYPLYADPRDRLKQSLWYALPPFLRGQPRSFHHEFWALRDVSFEVERGQTVGIIGRNGTGKSTLLQIIAGTLAPTHGEVQVHGRVAALLELGSGFNPEFTGRENVYLNGAILGFSQAEIDQIFDDIAAFADIGQFIDQPVKLYSSGMMVRLAFAVQVKVSKEVLIVDEALAVGDVAFQRKCMATLDEFRADNGTVLLVSHDTQQIVRQCDRCLFFDQGELLADGPSKLVTDLYQRWIYSPPQMQANLLTVVKAQGLEASLGAAGPNGLISPAKELACDSSALPVTAPSHTSKPWFDSNLVAARDLSYGNGDAQIIKYDILDEHNNPVNVLIMGDRYMWVYKINFLTDAYNVHFGMALKTIDGLDVVGLSSTRERVYFEHIKAHSVIKVAFSVELNITPGTYFFNAGIGGLANGEYTYLHRRVDLGMIRVISYDSREFYGIAYLKPQFSYDFL